MTASHVVLVEECVWLRIMAFLTFGFVTLMVCVWVNPYLRKSWEFVVAFGYVSLWTGLM